MAGDGRAATLAGVCFLGVVILGVGPVIQRYSWQMLLPPAATQLHLTPTQAAALRANHSFVIIGGPHRGGTTLLWRMLALHPHVSAFETWLPTDFGEGAFLQTVLPTFGVGDDDVNCLRPQLGTRPRGVGRYALSSSAHLTEESALNSERNSLKLLSQWGALWDLHKPLLLEKTPTNMVTSRLLQALLGTRTRFVFLSRHPLAVALAERHQSPCGRTDNVRESVLNWLAAHTTLQRDLPRLSGARVVRYEDVVAAPSECMRQVGEWLGLLPASTDAFRLREVAGDAVDADAVAAAAWQRALQNVPVSNSTNLKYEQQYCSSELASPAQRRSHCSLAAATQPAIDSLGLGYDVVHGGPYGFACLRHRLRLGVEASKRRSSHLEPRMCDGKPSHPQPALVAAVERITGVSSLPTAGRAPPNEAAVRRRMRMSTEAQKRLLCARKLHALGRRS